MSEWAVPSGMTPQDNPRQPKDGIQDLVQRFTAFRVEVRDKFNNLLSQAGIRVRPGFLASLDFDGDGGRIDLGTQGWMLGAGDGGPSFLVLNGVDVYASLSATDALILGQIADLAARVTVTTSIATFNTGALPSDATFHEYGADIPITIDVPTGRVVVTVGCGEASLNCGGGSVDAEATFSISGGVVPAYGSFVSRAFLQSGAGTWTSNSLVVQRAFVVTPGTYTITGKMRAYASGTATASVNFVQPYLTVQVTG